MLDKGKQKLKPVDLDVEKAEVIYSNLAVLSHSQAEFIFDFAQILPGMRKAEVRKRIIMTPLHARLLLRALTDNMKKFEDRFGKINIPEEARPGMEMGFKA
ncbi:DUF3467 domain-containing protein [candidate division WOR-3 bacterium]|nr:DUF3467 domain-containing protein [candidate division WOR-3 bacterium]MCK4525885.1 DUF3467 domain-containing protein [candidate division WOR-3 bacterium]